MKKSQLSQARDIRPMAILKRNKVTVGNAILNNHKVSDTKARNHRPLINTQAGNLFISLYCEPI